MPEGPPPGQKGMRGFPDRQSMRGFPEDEPGRRRRRPAASTSARQAREEPAKKSGHKAIAPAPVEEARQEAARQESPRHRLRSKTPRREGAPEEPRRPPALRAPVLDAAKPRVTIDDSSLDVGLAVGDYIVFNGHALGGRGAATGLVAGAILKAGPDKHYVVEMLAGEDSMAHALVRQHLADLEEAENSDKLSHLHITKNCKSPLCRGREVIHVKPDLMKAYKSRAEVPDWLGAHLDRVNADALRDKIAAEKAMRTSGATGAASSILPERG